MQMEMQYCLSTMRAGVDDESVTFFRNALLHSQCFRHHDHMSDQRLIPGLQFIDRGDVPVGNNEQVCGGYGMNIAKSRYQVIAINDLGGSLTGDNLAKDTGHNCLGLGDLLGRSYGIDP
jgi:hypothetical protein